MPLWNASATVFARWRISLTARLLNSFLTFLPVKKPGNSISEKLSVIDPEFFKQAYKVIFDIFSEYYTEQEIEEKHLIRVDCNYCKWRIKLTKLEITLENVEYKIKNYEATQGCFFILNLYI